MARQDRETLRRYFRPGALPSSDHFNDLIESMLNMRDEGFSKSAKDGLQISTLENNNSLISFYDHQDFSQSHWQIQFSDVITNGLEISATYSECPLLSFDVNGQVGINQPQPEATLDVNGFVKSKGTIGFEEKDVWADGEYHNITEELTGCHAFEVVAGIGLKGQGVYGLLQATAINTYFPNKFYDPFIKLIAGVIHTGVGKLLGRKNTNSEFFRSRRGIKILQSRYQKGRIKIRWSQTENGGYTLQLKTVCNCQQLLENTSPGTKDKVRVRYHIKQLWQDSEMLNCIEASKDPNAELGN